MNVALRVDGSGQLGNGHLARCLTLAKALRDQGFSCVFILRPLPGLWQNSILSAGFTCLFLSADELTQIEDANQSAALAREYFNANSDTKILWILDVYQLDASWHKVIRAAHYPLMVIDDLANRDYCADVLLDQTPMRSAQDYAGRVNAHCQLWVGAYYALLREEFSELRDAAKRQRASALSRTPKKILISLGGTDPHNYSASILQYLARAPNFSDRLIIIVLASNAPHLTAVSKLCSEYNNVTLQIDVQDMAALLLDATISLGAAGVSAIERASLGLPSLNFITADNQRLLAKNLAEQGCALNLGHCDENGLQTMLQELEQLMESNQRYQAMTNSGFALGSARGAQTTAQLLKDLFTAGGNLEGSV